MHYVSKFVNMTFEDAVAAMKEALQRNHFAVLAEIDLRDALRTRLAVDSRPYLILSACCLQLVPQAVEVDAEIGSMLLCDLIVQQCKDGQVEISTLDPADTIGAINDVQLSQIARDLRSKVLKTIDDVDPRPTFRRVA